MTTKYDPSATAGPRAGLFILQILVVGMFVLFSLRLWYLQVHKGDRFAEMARENQMRQASVAAARGIIWDRNGKAVAINEPSFALGLVREDCDDVPETLRVVSEWSGIDFNVLMDSFIRGKKRVKPFEPLILINDLSYETLAKIEVNSAFWPGLEVVVRSKRFYPNGELLSHVLGYVAVANEEELEKDPGLSLGDEVGKQGLEYTLESKLRGSKGLKQIEVDAHGREFNEQILKEPMKGENLSLSLDMDLQQHCAKLLEGQAGAVVVMEADTGQIRALVSQPSFDNNLFVLGLPFKKWKELRDNPMHPIQNRVMQSVYPPGSVFKLLMSVVGFSEGMLKPSDSATCSGSYKLGNHDFHCWKKGGHGTISLKQALVQSCDVYFYQLGERLGIDRISRVAQACGFGISTGIDLPHEKVGQIPSTEWKRKRYGQPWSRGETLNASIGQGYVQVSPLQVARFIGALVNGGKLLKPQLVATDPPVVQGKLPINDKDREFILQAMAETVQFGTAHKIFRTDALMGGKTGTAQVVKLANADNRTKTADMPYKYRDHSWLASFGQKGGKSYVVVCMVEHGGHAGEAAAPVVKSVYDYLFGQAKEEPKAKKNPEAPADSPAPAAGD